MKRLRPRHERFCRLFVLHPNAAQAARNAGYDPQWARNAGYRLLRQPRIVRRIADLHREMAALHCSDVDLLIGKLETVYRRSVDDHAFSAAARAVELQARLAGVAPEPRRPVAGTRSMLTKAAPSAGDTADDEPADDVSGST
jgi:hypothetical protein